MEEESSKKVVTVEEASKSKDPSPGSKRGFRTMKQLWQSRKLWMTIIACALLWIAYWREMTYLKSLMDLPVDKAAIFVPAFVSVTRDFMIIFGAVATAFVGVTGWVEWKHGTSSIINQAASYISEKKEQTTNYTERIIHEDDPNAPASKPFGQQAVD